MKKHISIICSLLSLFTACTGQNGDLSKEIDKNNHAVTVVIHNSPRLSDTVKISPHMSYQPYGENFIVWKNFHKTTCVPDTDVMDTIIVPVSNDPVLVQYKYGFKRLAQTIAQAGDELHIYYQKQVPLFRVANRRSAVYDGNLHILLDSVVYGKQSFRAEDMFDSYGFASMLKKEGLILKQESPSIYGQLVLADLQREQTVIDSLFQLNQLSAAVHAVYTDRILFQQHIIRLQLNQYTQATAAAIIDSLREVPVGKPYSYYTQFCEAYIQKFISGAMPVIRGTGSIIVDYRKLYDSVKRFTARLDANIRRLLLYKQLEQVAETFSFADLRKYLTDFEQTIGDTVLANQIRNTYLLDFEQWQQLSDSVYLLGADKQKTSLDAVLKANLGKVVFVDCWASWCLPCIAAMPHTKNLINQYQTKGLAVLFLSFDKKFEDWQKSSQKNELRYYKYNYLVINPATATYLQKLKVSSLPRYLIFNRKGQLVNANAADAKNKLTKSEIERLLKE